MLVAGLSTFTGTVTGKSTGDLARGAVAGGVYARFCCCPSDVGSFSSSVTVLRKGAVESRIGSHSAGVLDPVSSKVDAKRFVCAIEYRLKGSSVRPNSCDAAKGD